jgi:DNA-binding CsgD family transcriptional regulator
MARPLDRRDSAGVSFRQAGVTMYISARKHGVLMRLIETLAADHADGGELRVAIGRSLLDLLDADYYSSYVWNPQRHAFERGVALNMSDGHVEKYEAYFQYRHSPAARLWARRGVSPVSEVIARRDLMRTEIYNDFLRPEGHYYGINLYAFDGKRSIGDVRIWRKNGRPDFDSAEAQLLGLIERGFTRAMKRAEGRSLPFNLSPREASVAELAAMGCSDKEIARRLGVAFSTVRTHLDNAFAKLGSRNRTELAAILRGASARRAGPVSRDNSRLS